MVPFELHHPAALAEAAGLLASLPQPKLLAGGMTLLPALKQRLARPSDLIDLARVPGLASIAEVAGGLEIGAMTTHATVAADPLVLAKLPALAELAGHIGDPQVRERGTIGGSLANNDPAADYPAAVLALGATIVTDRRAIVADDFLTGMFTTALAEGEVIAAVRFPLPTRAAYAKFKAPASRYALAGAFVAETAAGVRVAITGNGTGAFRATAFESALAASFDPTALAGLTLDTARFVGDLHGDAAYRAHLAGVMVRRAVAAAVARSS
ncbi:FAD binding domain-containing protein [Paracraurococcus lichenis]|uniref:Xanthine dehydrogenase family protein subunit M n=1 Tax=Paracraurococcus lichenis TaxID=3064888 RepID=A0ABT9EAB9_9PROT|nr:xanthine dehydrogenase family protein subunit M [Paracraurococcus sp. LOR1-02]MDO9712913.1 xanthine dehydrogenase family protein subunit M [Paracraurococcus sp. LOR1-02]